MMTFRLLKMVPSVLKMAPTFEKAGLHKLGDNSNYRGVARRPRAFSPFTFPLFYF